MTVHLSPSNLEIKEMLAPAGILPEDVQLTTLPSDRHRHVYLVETMPQKQKLILKLFNDDQEVCGFEKEVRIHQLLTGNGAIPKLLYASQENPLLGSRSPYTVRTFIEGKTLQESLPELFQLDAGNRHEYREKTAAALGSALASLHRIGFNNQGYLDGELKVGRVAPLSGKELENYAEAVLVAKAKENALGKDLALRLLAFIEQEADLLDAVKGFSCLCHGKLGPAAILIQEGENQVSLLDFDEAFAGTPYLDFGNLRRELLELAAGEAEEETAKQFLQNTVASYKKAGGKLDQDWYRLSILSDLFNLLGKLDSRGNSEAELTIIKLRFSEIMTEWLFL